MKFLFVFNTILLWNILSIQTIATPAPFLNKFGKGVKWLTIGTLNNTLNTLKGTSRFTAAVVKESCDLKAIARFALDNGLCEIMGSRAELVILKSAVAKFPPGLRECAVSMGTFGKLVISQEIMLLLNNIANKKDKEDAETPTIPVIEGDNTDETQIRTIDEAQNITKNASNKQSSEEATVPFSVPVPEESDDVFYDASDVDSSLPLVSELPLSWKNSCRETKSFFTCRFRKGGTLLTPKNPTQ